MLDEDFQVDIVCNRDYNIYDNNFKIIVNEVYESDEDLKVDDVFLKKVYDRIRYNRCSVNDVNNVFNN